MNQLSVTVTSPVAKVDLKLLLIAAMMSEQGRIRGGGGGGPAQKYRLF